MDNVFNDTFFAMGTRCDVVLPSVEQEFGEQIFQLIKTETKDLENKLSRFIPDSEVSQLNNTPRKTWISVSEDLWEILTVCYELYQMSNGAFDITATPLISLWKRTVSPSLTEIENARRISGFDKVELDFENSRIRFAEDKMEFDFGAIGKGIALDKLKPVLIGQGTKNGIVSFGESSILALGNHPEGDYWPLGIRNLLNNEEFIHVFKAKDETVTTSGTILISDTGEIIKRHHIVSPETGMTIQGNISISVKSDSATFGEFLSTVWLILPENDKNLLAEKLKNTEILEVEYTEEDIKTKLTIL